MAGHDAGVIGSGPNMSGKLAVRFSGGFTGLLLFPFDGLLGFASATYTFHGDGSTSVDAHFGGWTTGLTAISRTHTGASATCVPGSVTCPTAALSGDAANAALFGGTAGIVYVAAVDLWMNPWGHFPTFVVMGIHFVPEPGTLLLLGTGVVALMVLGRRRLDR